MYLLGGLCYNGTCPANYYPNSTACLSCPSSCATCTSSSVCQTCATSYSLQDSQCVLVCVPGHSHNQVCYPCDLNCSYCNSTSGVCSLCTSPYLLYNNTCLSVCPSNMLSQNGQTCVLCTEQFVNCTSCSATACLYCNYGQLVNGSCKPCDPGYYEISASCVVCPSSCLTCTSQTDCQTCQPNYYYLSGICSASCPRNMFPNGTTCSSCGATCSICNQTTTLCTVCNAGVYLYNNSCYSTCPAPLVVSYDFLTCVTE